MLVSRKLILIVGLVAGCQHALVSLAQVRVPVVEAGQDNSPQAQPSQPAQATNSGQNEILVNMYLQLEALQSEVQNLRGLVEEQSFQIRRMQQEQRDRYLDTDSRLGELYNQVQAYHGGQPVPVQQPVGQAPGQQAPRISQSRPSNNPATASGNLPAASGGLAAGAGIAASPQSEQELYRQALNLLLEDEAFQDSITLFQQYLDVYPQGRYLTNALYWQGAALELVGNYDQAIIVLQRLLNEFPEDPKAPTALLRLGTVYREMGNTGMAAEIWQSISQRYPDSASEIEIANEYLAEISN